MNRCVQYFNSFYGDCLDDISYELNHMINKINKRNIIFLCIGSTLVAGDSLGPVIGSRLASLNVPHITVYGTMNTPVHAINLHDFIKLIRKEHKNSVVIAIDACLGIKEHIGYVTLAEAPLKPGSGVNKKLPSVGDISITGIIGTYKSDCLSPISNSDKYTFNALADCIYKSIIQIL